MVSHDQDKIGLREKISLIFKKSLIYIITKQTPQKNEISNCVSFFTFSLMGDPIDLACVCYFTSNTYSIISFLLLVAGVTWQKKEKGSYDSVLNNVTRLQTSLFDMPLPYISLRIALIIGVGFSGHWITERTNWVFPKRIYIIQVQYLTLNIGLPKIIAIIVIIMSYYRILTLLLDK